MNKDVEKHSKSLCSLIRTEMDTESKINTRPPEEEVPDRRPISGQINKYKKRRIEIFSSTPIEFHL